MLLVVCRQQRVLKPTWRNCQLLTKLFWTGKAFLSRILNSESVMCWKNVGGHVPSRQNAQKWRKYLIHIHTWNSPHIVSFLLVAVEPGKSTQGQWQTEKFFKPIIIGPRLKMRIDSFQGISEDIRNISLHIISCSVSTNRDAASTGERHISMPQWDYRSRR